MGSRCFAKSNSTTLTKKVLKIYTTALIKTLNESDPTVRDSSAEALGTAMKVVGEKAVMQYVADLEAIKLTKIKEYCDKAVVAGKSKTTASESKEPAKAAEAPKLPAAVIKKPAAASTNAAKKATGKVVVKKSTTAAS